MLREMTEPDIQMAAPGIENWRHEELDPNPAKQILGVQVSPEKSWKKNFWG